MGAETNPDSAGQNVSVTADASYTGDLTPDPGHHFPDVNMQIFGNFEGAGGTSTLRETPNLNK
jgi:hypothetical protein